jgi:Kef-type K+ transport system membrane component KefB
MKNKWLSYVLIILIQISIYGFISYFLKAAGSETGYPIILTGIVLISAYLTALLVKTVQLPKISGYMILGLALGPVGFNFLTEETLVKLSFLDKMALTFIAITAGGEFRISRLKKYAKSIVYQFSGQVVFVFLGVFLLLVASSSYLPFMSGLDGRMATGFSILFAATALSTSPAVTIGIITELKSKGKLTEQILSITVLKAIFLVVLFPLVITVAKYYLLENVTVNFQLMMDVGRELLGSVLLGVVFGVIIIGYLKYIKIEQSLFLLMIAVLITEVSQIVGWDILLISIITGIIVENFSKQGEFLILGIEKSSLPFYIIFFTFAGAGLHLDTLISAYGLTLVLVMSRMIFKFAGNYAGSALANETKTVKRLSWMGFLGQAGIAIGLGTVIEKALPGGIGTQFKTILISSVVVNELLGPIFFKYVLVKAKEVNV